MTILTEIQIAFIIIGIFTVGIALVLGAAAIVYCLYCGIQNAIKAHKRQKKQEYGEKR